MFETMGQFYAFFFPTLALIILGIIFEDKLVRFERKVFSALRVIARAVIAGVKQTVREKRAARWN